MEHRGVFWIRDVADNIRDVCMMCDDGIMRVYRFGEYGAVLINKQSVARMIRIKKIREKYGVTGKDFKIYC